MEYSVLSVLPMPELSQTVLMTEVYSHPTQHKSPSPVQQMVSGREEGVGWMEGGMEKVGWMEGGWDGWREDGMDGGRVEGMEKVGWMEGEWDGWRED